MNFREINYELAIKTNDQAIFEQIKTCLKQDFDGTLDWLFPKKGKILNRKYFTQFTVFWNSELPILFAEQLFSSSHVNELLQHYFNQFYVENNQVKYCSPPAQNLSVLLKMSEIIPDKLMTFIKTGQHFLNDQHFSTFDFFQYSPNADLQMFYKVCEIFRTITRKQEQEKRKFDKLINDTAIEDLLIHYSLYVEKIKWDYKYENYHPYMKVLTTMPDVMSEILRRKLSKNGKVISRYKSAGVFDLEVVRVVQDKIHNPKTYEFFEQMFEVFYGIYLSNSKYLDTFCFDKNYKVFLRQDKCLEFVPIDINQYHNWLKIGKKYSYFSGYYFMKAQMYLHDLEEHFNHQIQFAGNTEKHQLNNRMKQLNSYSYNMMLEDYGMLEEIETPTKEKINPYWLINVMELFGSNLRFRFVNEVENCFHRTKQHYLNCIQYVISKQAIEKKIIASPIRVNSYADFQKMTLDLQVEGGRLLDYKHSMNATAEQVKAGLDFFVLDLDKVNNITEINLATHPIIKLGDLCYSVSSIMASTSISFTILNRLLPNNKRKERNQETKEMANNLAKLFKERGFIAAAEIDIKKGKQPITDIDCAAYKDGVLFLIELKSTYIRTDLKEALDNENAMNKAGEQLEKIEDYVKENFHVIKSKLGMDWKIPLEEVQIYPLIISTSFEQDYQYFNGYKKISLMELFIILNNEKSLLFQTDIFRVGMFEKYFPDFDIHQLTSFPLDKKAIQAMAEKMDIFNPYETSLYPKGGNCSPKYIIEAIEKDKVWDFLDDEEYPKFSSVQDILSLDDKDRFNEHYSIFLEAMDAQYKENNTQKSMILVERALALFPDTDEYLILKGDNYARLGQLNKSIETLKKAVKVNPQNETAHCNLALSYLQIGNYQKALEHINISVSLNRSNQYALMNKGQIKALSIVAGLLPKSEKQSLLKDLKRVVAIDPNSNFGKEAKITLDKIKIT